MDIMFRTWSEAVVNGPISPTHIRNERMSWSACQTGNRWTSKDLNLNPAVNRQPLFPQEGPEELVRTLIRLSNHCSMWWFYWAPKTFTGNRGMARANNIPTSFCCTPVDAQNLCHADVLKNKSASMGKLIHRRSCVDCPVAPQNSPGAFVQSTDGCEALSNQFQVTPIW